MKTVARILAMIQILGSMITGCTTTYTEAELRAEEPRRDAEARAENKRDREIGQEGGANLQSLEEDEEWAETDAER